MRFNSEDSLKREKSITCSLETKIENFKTQLTFKERELSEAKRINKILEERINKNKNLSNVID